MKTQISRRFHHPFRRYSGVYQQQGRLLSDADWNALTDIEKQRHAAALADTVASGAPREAGLELVMAEAGIAIRPGTIYVNGHDGRHAGGNETVTGETVPLTAQADYPDAPPWSAPNRTLYVDLWERTVTALEDTELLDAALHGADTCTRTRTMVQVKWCDRDIDPADPAVNPPLGSAGLHLRLRKVFQSGDPCDPCSEEVPVDERIGNYLFRVEVHDHYVAGGETFVVLKWSRENGAEHHPATDMPPEFGQGDWTWEIYDVTAEKLAGRHFPLTDRRHRGELVTDFTVIDSDDTAARVRRWDGHALLNLSAGTVVEGHDRGVELDGTLGGNQHGWFAIDEGVWTVNLELMVMRLQVADVDFLAGDYWQAPVREAEHEPGDDVLGSDTAFALPQGIEHHYLVLGHTDAEGRLEPLTDPQRRRLHFPPLTDLRAADVGFENRCEGLYGSAQNLQDALDNLCEIGADDIAYPVPDCSGGVAARLPESALPEAGTRASVKTALDALLCEFDARHLPLAKGETNLCPELASTDVNSVQDALRRLCELQRDYCAIPVRPGELPGLLNAFADEPERRHLSLCLLPGEHRLDGINLRDKAGLRLVGAGDGQSRLVLAGEENQIDVEQLQIQGIGVELLSPEGRLTFVCNDLDVARCRFTRLGQQEASRSMVFVIPKGALPRARWHENDLHSSWSRWIKDFGPDVLFPADIAGDAVAVLVKRLHEQPELMDDPLKYDAWLRDMIAELAVLSQEQRITLGKVILGVLSADNRFARVSDTGTPVPVMMAPHAGMDYQENTRYADKARKAMSGLGLKKEQVTSSATHVGFETASGFRYVPEAKLVMAPLVAYWNARGGGRFLAALMQPDWEKLIAGELMVALDDLLAPFVLTGISPALEFATTGMDVTVVHNRIRGHLILRNGAKQPVEPIGLDAKLVMAVPLVPSGRLTLQDCQIGKLVGFLEEGLVSGNTASDGFHCFQTIQLLDNTFDMAGSSAIAAQLDCRGNQFNAESPTAEDDFIAVWLRAGQAMVGHNMAAEGMLAKVRLIAESGVPMPNLMTVST